MVKTAGYSTRVATDAPHAGTIYSSPHDFTVAMYDYTASAAWVTATPYVVGDVRKNGAAGYRCIADHTSSATDEPGAAAGVNWRTYWELLGANVLLLSALNAKLTGMDISWFSRVLVYPSGHSPALPYQPIEDPKMRWDDTNKLLWIPDTVVVGDVVCVEIRGPNREDIEVGNIEVQLEMKADGVGEKSDSIITGSTVDHSVPATGNLSPVAKPYYVDTEGRQAVAGTAPSGGVEENDSPVKFAGSDYAGTKATKTTTLGVPQAELVYTAVKAGPEGNSITVAYENQTASGITVTVVVNAITVKAKIADNVDAIDVLNAVNADPYAKALVLCELAPGNDGSGHIIAMGAITLATGAGHSHVNEVKVSIDGELTEVSAGDIKTAVETVAEAVGADDATPDKGVAVQGYASDVLPSIGIVGKLKKLWCDLYGRLHVYVDSALNRTNDEVKAEDIPPPEIVVAGLLTTSATVGNTSQLTAVHSDLKRGVFLRVSPKFVSNAMAGVSYTSGNGTIIDAGGNPVAGLLFHRDATYTTFIPIDDPSKLYLASDTASTVISWVGI